MIIIKNVFLILTMLLALTNCSENNSIEYPKEIEFLEIIRGSLYGGGREGFEQSNLVIKNQTQWQNVMTKMDSYNNVSDKFTETDIDFNSHIIIAIFDEVKRNGGHSIDVIKVHEDERSIIITIDNLHKGDITLVITQPYHLIKIPITEKPITFEYPKEIEFLEIIRGSLYGGGREGFERLNLVIKNQTQWQNVMTKMDSYNNVSDKFTETDIDFNSHIIIAIFDEVKRNGGHSIDVIKVHEDEHSIIITIDNLHKGDITSVITQPYHLIKIPITEKPITFVKE